MRSFLLRLIFGVILLIISTPRTMATEVIREDTRADFFCAQGFDEREERAAFTLDEAALLPAGEVTVEGETSVEGGKDEPREQKRQSAQKIFISKCRFVKFLSAEKMSRGVARNPGSQDARQERTAAIRFLHQKSLPVA